MRGTLIVLGWICALGGVRAMAGNKAQAPATDRYARRCQDREPSRWIDLQGTMLWGTWSGWTEKERTKSDDRKSVLVSAQLDGMVQSRQGVKVLRLESGRLTAAGGSAAGSVLQGMGSDGRPVEVAICDAETVPGDNGTTWYRIEVWNSEAREWENPCVPTEALAHPRALAVGGVWDTGGAHHDVAGKITFACQGGVIAKCATWGYRPWASHGGTSLAEAHQACTRMARADYCGNGQSHTREGTLIDYYDSLGLSSRATSASSSWDPARASFEAAWAPDGATCIARTRGGDPVAAILKECPGRFKEAPADLGNGDRCVLQRAGQGPAVGLLRNRVGGAPAPAAGR